MERICFLEWRLEQLQCALEDKEKQIQQQRIALAEGADREVEAAERLTALERRLADARREAVTLGDRSVCGDAVRSELEGRLADFGEKSASWAKLERELEVATRDADRSRALLDEARERISILESGRERFFAKLVQWQQMGGDQSKLDLAEFIAELRAEISRLSSENARLAQQASHAPEVPRANAAPGISPSVQARAPRNPESRLLGSTAKGAGSDRPAAHSSRRDVERPAPERADASGPAPLRDPDRATARAASPQSHAGAGEDRVESDPRRAPETPVRETPGHQTAGHEIPGHETPAHERPVAAERAERFSSDRPVTVADARAHLLHALRGTARGAHAERLISELFSESPLVRQGAARALVSLAGEHAAPALVAALHGASDPKERTELLGLLAKTGAVYARIPLEQAQRDEVDLVRGAAVDALVAYARDDVAYATVVLTRGLSDPSARVRRRAILAAVSIPKFEPGELLLPLVSDEDPQIRRSVCSALAGVRTVPVCHALIGRLLDADLAVRRATAGSLERIFGRSMAGVAELPESERRREARELRERLRAHGEDAFDPQPAEGSRGLRPRGDALPFSTVRSMRAAAFAARTHKLLP